MKSYADIYADVLHLLEKEKFCSLATSYGNNPHVCLMNFTYLAEEDLMILSSRTDTTKVLHMGKNPSVAVLLYSLGGQGEESRSCTLYGKATILPAENDRFYRKAHHKHHPTMGAFIMGENISIITVRIEHAALSDQADHVQTWSAAPDLKHDSST